jgi:hypothetical protein
MKHRRKTGAARARSQTRLLLLLLAVAAILVGVVLAVGLAHADEPACVDDPPHICLPGNPEGKPAACYDDGGVIVALWPCAAWKPADGYRHGRP